MADERSNPKTEPTFTKEQQAAQFASILGEKNFDKDKFELDVQKLKDAGKDLNLLDPADYRKKKDNPDKKPDYDNGSLSFSTQRRGGSIIITGSDGSQMEAKTPEEKHKMVAQAYKRKAANEPEEQRKNLAVAFESPNKDPVEMEIFAKTFINEGIGVAGDVPQNPKFWQDFKKEYLANPEHSAEQWKHLTRKVPPEYMGDRSREQTQTQSSFRLEKVSARTGQQQTATMDVSQQPNMNKRDFIHNLRNGNNLNLSPSPEKPIKQRNNSQVQEILRRRLRETKLELQ